MKKRKKYAITLIEIMIVILLIGMIGGTLAFNMRGSLDKGRAFKTEQNIMRIKDIVMMEYASGTPMEKIAKEPKIFLKASCLVKDVDQLTKDGWNIPLTISFQGDEIEVTSEALAKFQEKHGS